MASSGLIQEKLDDPQAQKKMKASTKMHAAVLLATWLFSWNVAAASNHFFDGSLADDTFSDNIGPINVTLFIAWPVLGMVDGVRQNSHLYFRRRGGIGDYITDDLDNNHRTDASWGYISSLPEARGPWIHLNRSLSTTVRDLDAGHQDYIIFAVAASPNMVTLEEDPSRREATHAALGGIQWTQIRAWTYLSWDQWRYPASFEWQMNREFNRSWERLGPSGPQPALRGPPSPGRLAEASPVHGPLYEAVAWSFMGFLTEPGTELRNLFAELVDWDLEFEPWRNFPLLRRGILQDEVSRPATAASSPNPLPESPPEPESLQTIVLRQLDWANLDVPLFIRHAMLASAALTPQLCDAALRSARSYYGHQRRAAVLPPSYDVFLGNVPVAPDTCHTLYRVFQSRCDSVSALHVDFSIGTAWLWGAGTNDAVGLLLGPPSVIPLLKAPSGGDEIKNMSINLKTVFGAEIVPLRDIKVMQLLDTPLDSYWGPDWWKFGGITLTATCASSAQKLELADYNQVNQAVLNEVPAPYGPQVVWSRDIDIEHWKPKK
ncbi:putative enterotoxin [Ophiocordyceps camponoti-rufipedis]|uniref:Putative enterotoxin n=1 Tax=Ophiocordyceps camponoti-rufipedis TaxID=2004952 RepID=A0A2C5YQG6_9HYPO|nr:putative enterotoxin [Ophiocordyceps camponoti-rufipedis]